MRTSNNRFFNSWPFLSQISAAWSGFVGRWTFVTMYPGYDLRAASLSSSSVSRGPVPLEMSGSAVAAR